MVGKAIRGGADGLVVVAGKLNAPHSVFAVVHVVVEPTAPVGGLKSARIAFPSAFGRPRDPRCVFTETHQYCRHKEDHCFSNRRPYLCIAGGRRREKRDATPETERQTFSMTTPLH